MQTQLNFTFGEETDISVVFDAVIRPVVAVEAFLTSAIVDALADVTAYANAHTQITFQTL